MFMNVDIYNCISEQTNYIYIYIYSYINIYNIYVYIYKVTYHKCRYVCVYIVSFSIANHQPVISLYCFLTTIATEANHLTRNIRVCYAV